MDYCTDTMDTMGLRRALLVVWMVFFAIMLVWVGYFVDRGSFTDLMGYYSLLFGFYLLMIRFESDLMVGITWKQVIGLGIFLRFLFVFSTPNLSDDWCRFLWDGMMVESGVHPFLYTPREAMELGSLPSYAVVLLERMNSPDYHTVYPPLSQFVYWLSVRLGAGEIGVSLMALKLLIIIGELFTMIALGFFLGKLQVGLERVGLVWYAFNPLVILETVGNVHFEGLMVGFLVMGCWALQAGRVRLAAVLWASAVSVKLLPLLVLPVLLVWLGKRRAIQFAGVGLVSLLIYFLPLAKVSVMGHLLASVGLYFRQFEFNASVYYLGAYGSRWITGWHEGRLVSPLLASATFSLAVCLAVLFYRRRYWKMEELQFALLILWTTYLLNSATVHPWYVLVPFVLSLGTGCVFPLVWTWVVYFSYSHYAAGLYQEHFGWIVLEYLVLGISIGMDIVRWSARGTGTGLLGRGCKREGG